MSNPPSTPPRLRNSGQSQPVYHSSFHTPKTPKHSKDIFFATPSSSSKSKPQKGGLFKTPRKQHQQSQSMNLGIGTHSLLPITPEITPLRSPNRSTRKKRVHVDEITTDNPVHKLSRNEDVGNSLADRDFAFGLLLPAPSTIGMGRKVSSTPAKTPLSSSPTLDSDFFANIAHEEDLEDYTQTLTSPPEEEESLPSSESQLHSLVHSHPEPQTPFIKDNNIRFMHPIDYNHVEASPTKKISRKSSRFNTPNIPQSPRLTQTPKLSQTPKLPQTPAGQLINEDIVYKWHGKSFNSDFSTDEECNLEDTIETEDVENPFLSPNMQSYNQFKTSRMEQYKKSNIDYSTHMEMVNNRTGEHKIMALSSEQAKIKPKRLDFSSFK